MNRQGTVVLITVAVVVTALLAWWMLTPSAKTAVVPDTATIPSNGVPDATPRPGAHLPLEASCFGEQALAAKDYPVAYQAFLSRAGKDAQAELLLGVMFRDGLGVVRNPQMAIDRFVRAAGMGSVPAMTALGWMFSMDRDTGTNYREAFTWYERAALQGDRAAQFHLADMYRHGSGTAADLVQAHAWLTAIGDAPVSADHAMPMQGPLPVTEAREQVYRALTREQAAQAASAAAEIKKKIVTPAGGPATETQPCAV